MKLKQEVIKMCYIGSKHHLTQSITSKMPSHIFLAHRCYFPSTGTDESGKLRLFSVPDGQTSGQCMLLSVHTPQGWIKVVFTGYFPSTPCDRPYERWVTV